MVYLQPLDKLFAQKTVKQSKMCSKTQQEQLVQSLSQSNPQFSLYAFHGVVSTQFTPDLVNAAWRQVSELCPILCTIYAAAPGTDQYYESLLDGPAADIEIIGYEKDDDLDIRASQIMLPTSAELATTFRVHLFTSPVRALLRLSYDASLSDRISAGAFQSAIYMFYHKIFDIAACCSKYDTCPPATELCQIVPEIDPSGTGAKNAVVEISRQSLQPASAINLTKLCETFEVQEIDVIQALWLLVIRQYTRSDYPESGCSHLDLTKKGGAYTWKATERRTTYVGQNVRVLNLVKAISKPESSEAQPISDPKTNRSQENKSIFSDTIIRWVKRDTMFPTGSNLHCAEFMTQGAHWEHDLTITISNSDDFLTGEVQHTKSISPSQARRALNLFVGMLEHFLDHPQTKVTELPSCSTSDLELLQQWNSTPQLAKDSCIPDLIHAAARKNGCAPAIASHDGSLSYHELCKLSSRLARLLSTEYGLSTADKALLIFPKTQWVVVAMLSVMQTGAAFVPLDPSVPLERLQSVMAQTRARHIITTRDMAPQYAELDLQTIVLEDLGAVWSTDLHDTYWISPDLRPHDLAYVIFTSGSTGEPKGIAIEHRAFCSTGPKYGSSFGMNSETRALQFCSYAFDVSLVEILVSLFCGSCICIPSDHDRTNDIGQAISKLRVNWAVFTPSVAATVARQVTTDLNTVVLAGEPVTASARDQWSHRTNLLGGYGPSETTPISAVANIREEVAPTNIGYPAACHCWVVDPANHDRLVPIGAPGELLIEGPGLGRGYLGDASKTSAVFIVDPAWAQLTALWKTNSPRRMYKTGDLVRQLDDGSLEYIGRKDMQVKIRGNRVELGDIEAHLIKLLGVELAVEAGIPYDSSTSDPVLVAFVCLQKGPHDLEDLVDIHVESRNNLQTMVRAIQQSLRCRIPSYMIPHAYLPIRALPLTTSAKTDRKRLRAIIRSLRKSQLSEWQSSSLRELKPLETELELRLGSLWARALDVDSNQVSLGDDFIEQGGDSLTAMKLSELCNEAGLPLFFKDIVLNSLFHAQIELLEKRLQTV